MVNEIEQIHKSVLLQEVLEFLAPEPGKVYVDCNLGLGGHTAAILDRCSPSGIVIGFDWDADAIELARTRLAVFGKRAVFVHDNFANLKERLAELEIDSVDGVLLDLGLSSLQLDECERGFSFQGSQALDMRMDVRKKENAADLVNKASREELADIFYYYGEDRQARRIAAFIVESRKEKPIETTDELVGIIERAVPKRFRPKKIHVATKVFQGLRIAVNGELDNLEKVLAAGEDVLKPGGIFCVISFHSLEDRLVKRVFQQSSRLKIVTSKPVIAGDKECDSNPRSRSAKLRVARKIENERAK